MLSMVDWTETCYSFPSYQRDLSSTYTPRSDLWNNDSGELVVVFWLQCKGGLNSIFSFPAAMYYSHDALRLLIN